MPHRFEVDRVHGILRCWAEGKVDDGEIRQFHTTARALSKQLHPRCAILDLTAVTALEVSLAAVQGLVQSPPSFGDAKVPTFVIAPSPSVYGMARMFQLMSDKTRPMLLTFRQAGEAYAKLGVSEPKFEAIETPQV
jgi:hypothetical protein